MAAITTMKISMTFCQYEDEIFKFFFVNDNQGELWFSAAPIVEMLQSESIQNDSVINTLNNQYKTYLKDIMSGFKTCDKLPLYLHENSIMI